MSEGTICKKGVGGKIHIADTLNLVSKDEDGEGRWEDNDSEEGERFKRSWWDAKRNSSIEKVYREKPHN